MHSGSFTSRARGATAFGEHAGGFGHGMALWLTAEKSVHLPSPSCTFSVGSSDLWPALGTGSVLMLSFSHLCVDKVAADVVWSSGIRHLLTEPFPSAPCSLKTTDGLGKWQSHQGGLPAQQESQLLSEALTCSRRSTASSCRCPFFKDTS